MARRIPPTKKTKVVKKVSPPKRNPVPVKTALAKKVKVVTPKATRTTRDGRKSSPKKPVKSPVASRKPRGPYRPRAATVATPTKRRRTTIARIRRAQPGAGSTLDGFLSAINAVFTDQLALAVHQADSATRETIATLISLRKISG